MQPKALLTLAALAVVGLVCAAVVLFSGSGAPAISVRLVKSVQSGESAVANFNITNHSSRLHILSLSYSVERRNGQVWKECSWDDTFRELDLAPRSYQSVQFQMTNVPTGAPLRLKLEGRKELKGVQTLWMRFRVRFVLGEKGLPLNPFDRNSHVFQNPTPIFSDEFVLPSVLAPPSPEPTPKSSGVIRGSPEIPPEGGGALRRSLPSRVKTASAACWTRCRIAVEMTDWRTSWRRVPLIPFAKSSPFFAVAGLGFNCFDKVEGVSVFSLTLPLH